jgi:DNA-binding NtrC family response regulator
MATVKAGSVIEAEDLDPVFQKRLPAEDMSLKEAVTSFEREFIGQVLEQNDFNRTKAAQKLGIHRNTLIAKIQELGLDG